MKGLIKKYIRPKRKNYQKLKTIELKIIEELGRKITQLECKVEILQGRAEQLRDKNMQLRIINKRCNGLFGTFMYKCLTAEKRPKDALNKIYWLSRKILEEIK